MRALRLPATPGLMSFVSDIEVVIRYLIEIPGVYTPKKRQVRESVKLHRLQYIAMVTINRLIGRR